MQNAVNIFISILITLDISVLYSMLIATAAKVIDYIYELPVVWVFVLKHR